jgi:Uma2 family endonuclease
MATLVLDPHTPELEALRERRKQSGIDRLDEVWEGVLHMVPAPNDAHADIGQQLAELLGPPARAAGLFPTIQEFNVGDSTEDYRVPDGGLHRSRRWGTWEHTLPLVVEIVSPGDETWKKLSFYAARNVDEVLIVDPEQRVVHWLALRDGEYQPIERSGLIELGPDQLGELIDWP